MKGYLKTRKVYVILKPVTSLEAQNLTSEPVMNSASPTVNQMTHYFMQWSDNVLSDRLSRIAAKAAGFNGSAEGIAEVYARVLAELEINSSKLVVKDGSGLSHDNRLSAKLLGDLLVKIYKEPRFAGVIESLPDGGINGTLNERFIKTAPNAIGLVHAKTGTLNGTVTLAGYIESGDREYVFVVLADRLSRTYSAAKIARDTLDRYLGRIALPLVPIIETETVVSSITP
jgi:D-alanyl-D-alanine carboxypeptidase/D-alanyl-D-alanine-endopeptidase (penicillin-binding protein 4)